MKIIAMTFLVVYSLSTPKEFKGRVTDFNSNEKLAGVMVVANEKDTTYSDFDGNFVFKNIDKIKSIDFNLTSYEKSNFILVNESVDSVVIRGNKVMIAEKN